MMDVYGWTVLRPFVCEFKQEEYPDTSPRRSYRVDANASRKARKEKARELTRKRMAELQAQKERQKI